MRRLNQGVREGTRAFRAVMIQRGREREVRGGGRGGVGASIRDENGSLGGVRVKDRVEGCGRHQQTPHVGLGVLFRSLPFLGRSPSSEVRMSRRGEAQVRAAKRRTGKVRRHTHT